MKEEEDEEEEREDPKMKRDQWARPHLAYHKERREKVRCLCGPKLKALNTRVPQVWVKLHNVLNM